MDGGDFDAVPAATGLVIDLDGYEGPIDVLLQLAREQKVDLARLSILALAEQYLAFVERARRQHLELAADYLVMAAWLAYLKSRLLLPPEPATAAEEPSADELAAALQFRLRRLEAMQQAGAQLLAQPRLGRDVFARGAPEGVAVVTRVVPSLGLYDLLRAYGQVRGRTASHTLTIEAADLHSMEDAIKRLQGLLGTMLDWTILARFLPSDRGDRLERRSAIAAFFVAGLELTRQGRAELRQEGGPFAPLYIRARA